MEAINKTFQLGRMCLTRRVNELVAENLIFAKFVLDSLKRHARGDWGDLSSEDLHENEMALSEGNRLFSAYKANGQPTIWIITEANRSVTTVLFPEEY